MLQEIHFKWVSTCFCCLLWEAQKKVRKAAREEASEDGNEKIEPYENTQKGRGRSRGRGRGRGRGKEKKPKAKATPKEKATKTNAAKAKPKTTKTTASKGSEKDKEEDPIPPTQPDTPSPPKKKRRSHTKERDGNLSPKLAKVADRVRMSPKKRPAAAGECTGERPRAKVKAAPKKDDKEEKDDKKKREEKSQTNQDFREVVGISIGHDILFTTCLKHSDRSIGEVVANQLLLKTVVYVRTSKLPYKKPPTLIPSIWLTRILRSGVQCFQVWNLSR